MFSGIVSNQMKCSGFPRWLAQHRAAVHDKKRTNVPALLSSIFIS
jgi:hypothetical protein